MNRLKSADFSSWSGSAWTSTLAHDLTNIAYDRSGNLTSLRRYREAATLIDQLTYTNPLFEEFAFGFTAENMGAAAPSYGNRLSVGWHSLPGRTLDFKQHLPSRALWKAGGGLVVHKHAVGNAAWGYCMARQGYSLQQALVGARAQGMSVGGEDPLDQVMIRRGFGLYR